VARKNKYPGVYARWNTLWIQYRDENGEKIRESTGLPLGKEREAHQMLKTVKSRMAAAQKVADELGGEGPVTLQAYAQRWVEKRKARGISSARDELSRFKMHITPHRVDGIPLGLFPLADIEPLHIRDLVRDLMAETNPEKKLAPRTIRNLYGMLHTMFIDARMERLIVANPCELPRDALPKKRDKDPLWRSSAHFSREEVELLISDERIPWDRRVINSLLFLAGVRWGEMAALRWREYETAFRSNLGRLVIARSFEHRKRVIKPVKTEVPRWVPVHPTLAKMLAEWKLGGWPQMMGRAPTLDDFIVPNAPVLLHSSGVPLAMELQQDDRKRISEMKPDDVKHCRMPQMGLDRAKADCEKLGLRKRRNHDARRTMISLARAGGASKDLLEWVTHGPPGDVIDGYTTLPWETLCQQVQCIRIERLEGKVLAMPVAASAGGRGLEVVEAARAPKGVQAGHRFGHRCLETTGTAKEKLWGVQDSDL
jgi:integrase